MPFPRRVHHNAGTTRSQISIFHLQVSEYVLGFLKDAIPFFFKARNPGVFMLARLHQTPFETQQLEKATPVTVGLCVSINYIAHTRLTNYTGCSKIYVRRTVSVQRRLIYNPTRTRTWSPVHPSPCLVSRQRESVTYEYRTSARSKSLEYPKIAR